MEEKELVRALKEQPEGPGHRTRRCPDEAVLAAYADARLDEVARQQVEDHLATCEFCLDHVAFLVRESNAEVAAEVPPALLARAREFGGAQAAPWALVPRWGLAAAVTATFALAAGLWLGQPESVLSPSAPSETPAVGAVTPAAQNPAPTVSPPAPAVRHRTRPVLQPDLVGLQEGAVVPLEGAEFRWHGVDRSLFYEIRVVTADGSLLWEQRVEATHVRLPADVQLAAGQKYFVWVRAYLPEGKTLKSATVGFTAAKNP